MKQIIHLFVLVILLSGCGSDDSDVSSLDKDTIEQYLSDNNLAFSTTSEGAYQYEIIGNPTGNNSGDVFSIYYTLSDLETGVVIDSYLVGDGDPIKLKRSASAIFPQGLDYGLAGIREGETYGIILTQSLGYRDFNTNTVPLGTLLHFEVEVITRETEANIASDEDTQINSYITTNNLNNTTLNPIDAVVALANGIYYKRTGAGNGTTMAVGDSITIDYSGTLLDNTSFDNLSGFKYKFGSGNVIDGLDVGVKEMEQGEDAKLFIPSAQAYSGSVRVIPEATIDELVTQFVVPDYVARVKPYEVLVFDVTLQTIH